MKRLQVEGVKVEKPYEKTVKVGLAYLVGDNLGQHSIAEQRWVPASVVVKFVDGIKLPINQFVRRASAMLVLRDMSQSCGLLTNRMRLLIK